jgi:hypothetical protein
LLTACSAIALAACGGQEKETERRTDTWPRIERSLAASLAARSDAVADRLDRGDNCGAAAEAARLRDEVTASIGSIPQVYVEDFSGLVNEIQAQIPPCEEPPVDDRKEDKEGDDDEDRGKGKEKGKKKGKDKDD